MRPIASLLAIPIPLVLGGILQPRQNPPACVLTCIENAATAVGCNIQNFSCLCNSATFIDDFTFCAIMTCDAADVEIGVQDGLQACQAIGITPSIPASASMALATFSDSTTPGQTPIPQTTSSSIISSTSETLSSPSSSSISSSSTPSVSISSFPTTSTSVTSITLAPLTKSSAMASSTSASTSTSSASRTFNDGPSIGPNNYIWKLVMVWLPALALVAW